MCPPGSRSEQGRTIIFRILRKNIKLVQILCQVILLYLQVHCTNLAHGLLFIIHLEECCFNEQHHTVILLQVQLWIKTGLR